MSRRSSVQQGINQNSRETRISSDVIVTIVGNEDAENSDLE